ncbi:MAG: ChrR family anti-sigma-E factor [Proteobacteria bacterium]|jgi:putative transcriptional regulator|nr:ChrR family anti-sigma-E factor [Pseudomonadota bacterium]MDA1300718.1 ChrR family anti-sigma-E factor [Pseudomonadota bacterium]
MSTTNASKHPDSSWLVSYSAGGLGPSFSVILQAHLAVCARCRCTLKQADVLGAEFMFGAGEVPVGSFSTPPHEIGVRADEPIEWSRDTITDLPQFFDQYIGTHLDCLNWMAAGKGLKVCKLSSQPDDRLWMLRAQPGTVLPRHSHSGSELTLVLKGAYFCEDTIYGVGDIEDATDETLHQPMVSAEGECICIAAVDGPLRFTGLLPRLAQRFIGI